MKRKPEKCCRFCEEQVACATRPGAPWLVQCSKCGHSICPMHVHFRKVRGEDTYYVTCNPQCKLRKVKPKDERIKTGVNEWDYFHDRPWNR